MVKLADVMQVSTRHDQGVAWMKLPQVDNGENQFVLQNDLGRAQSLCDFTKDASVSHVRSCKSNDEVERREVAPTSNEAD
jgi:hypothetical protein